MGNVQVYSLTYGYPGVPELLLTDYSFPYLELDDSKIILKGLGILVKEINQL